jgi:hypothetical protein
VPDVLQLRDLTGTKYGYRESAEGALEDEQFGGMTRSNEYKS